MIFYSELIGKNVVSEHHHDLGKFRDLIFLNEDTPTVIKMVVQTKYHRHEIAIDHIKMVNHHIEVTQVHKDLKHRSKEVSAAKMLLDKQIIDLVGNKVVRVNDIIIQEAPILSISGIDIGVLGIIRRLGLERFIRRPMQTFHIELPLQLLSWGDILNLEYGSGQIQLKHHEERLARIHEEDLADYLETTTIHNARSFLKTIGIKKASNIIENLTTHYQIELFNGFEPAKAAEIITLIDPDVAVDILLTLHRKNRDKITQLLTVEKQSQLHRLMTLSRTPVGKLMTSEFCAVESHTTARDVLKTVRKTTTDFSSLPAVYVLNREDQLVGVFNLHELIMQDLDTPAYRFMIPEPIVVLMTTPLEVVISKFLKYKIPILPVINRDKKILGIITIDDISDIILRKIQ